MALRIFNFSVPTTGYTNLLTATDTDRDAGGAIQGGQGFEVKNEGTSKIKIFDSRKDAAGFRTLDVGESWGADLDYSSTNDQVYAQAIDAAGSVSVTQVGVAP